MTDLLAADSWLVDDGRVRAVERHWARFAATCREHGVEPDAVARLRADVARAVPPRGRWFPRVELRADGGLAVRVRPAPPRDPTVVAWVADVADPRRDPRRKGPDLERLAALRERAAAHGAREALICDADGRLIEGAFTSLLWWEGETLFAVPEGAPILLGITRALLLELARDRGTPVAQRRPAPGELADRETWLVSALHGIRVVTGWANGGPPAGRAPRAGGWQRLLDGLTARQAV
ncbi:MAG TPA: aminotransferase class IV [Solirubrobacteraceae bacterium]|jgi:branched-subunit amino acid aminotransferase/4-amino-4-deoxychorismate lyase|nr:aminotransferase class IV [Solirubrobacteraceae bacterium]